jgi:hypothetical protein
MNSDACSISGGLCISGVMKAAVRVRGLVSVSARACVNTSAKARASASALMYVCVRACE